MKNGPASEKPCGSAFRPLPAFAGSWWAGSHLAHAWLPDQTGLALFLAAASIGVTGGLLGLVIGIAMAGVGAGYAARAITIRLAATLRFLVPDGIKSLPDNWRENNFVIDTMTPAELVPGIGKRNESLTLNGVINRLKEADIALKFAFFLFIPIWFIPVFFYRLNIKATCWFYWPLAFLLRPLPTDDRMERRQRDLCWPWTNPAQLSLIIGSGALGLFAVFASLIEIESLLGFAGWSGVPFWLEYLFILDWSRLEPWHWANLSIAVTGIAMLLIAGNAVAAYKAGLDYGQETPWSLPAMHLLWRLRTLAVVATLLLALGSVVVHLQPGWLDYLPARQAQAVAEFYG